MPKKKYRSKYTLSLSVAIKIDGENRFIDFDGGYVHPRRMNGTYSTSNPKIQESLEKHPFYKKEFDLVKVFESPEEKAVTKEAKEPVEEATVIEAAPQKDDHIVSEAANGQQAKEELNKKHGIPWSRLKNLEMVRAESKILGIIYPNWNA